MQELKTLVLHKWQERRELGGDRKPCLVQDRGLLDENGKKRPTPGRSGDKPQARKAGKTQEGSIDQILISSNQ